MLMSSPRTSMVTLCSPFKLITSFSVLQNFSHTKPSHLSLTFFLFQLYHSVWNILLYTLGFCLTTTQIPDLSLKTLPLSVPSFSLAALGQVVLACF
jgi:hypothetical protein